MNIVTASGSGPGGQQNNPLSVRLEAATTNSVMPVHRVEGASQLGGGPVGDACGAGGKVEGAAGQHGPQLF